MGMPLFIPLKDRTVNAGQSTPGLQISEEINTYPVLTLQQTLERAKDKINSREQ